MGFSDVSMIWSSSYDSEDRPRLSLLDKVGYENLSFFEAQQYRFMLNKIKWGIVIQRGLQNS